MHIRTESAAIAPPVCQQRSEDQRGEVGVSPAKRKPVGNPGVLPAKGHWPKLRVQFLGPHNRQIRQARIPRIWCGALPRAFGGSFPRAPPFLESLLSFGLARGGVDIHWHVGDGSG
jgi:hypothetical protein